MRFKLIHLSSLILLIVAIKKVKENYKYLKHDEFLIIFALIGSTFALIAHQLMIINGIFIFFMIPILAGFSHVYYLKYFKKKNYIVYLLIFLSISSTAYYGYEYINKRKIIDELYNSKKIFKKHNWPIIDVTRKSVEETAASVIKIFDILNSK